MALGSFLQWWTLGECTTGDTGSSLGSTSPVAITGPGAPPAPGPQRRMPNGELDTPLTAEGAGDEPTFAPPPTAPAPALQLYDFSVQLPPYYPGALFPGRLAAPGNPMNVEGFEAKPLIAAATARVSAEGGQLTRDEMIAVLRAAGWPESVIPDALAVAFCESKWSPYAHNGGNAGLFQLNVTDGATTRGSWFAYWGLPEDGWSDPVTNATAARLTYEYSLARNGYGWSPWSCKPS